MRILATLALVGIVSVFAVQGVQAQSNGAFYQDIKQKQKSESSEDRVISINENFIASGYITEIDQRRLKKFEQDRKRFSSVDYSKLPQGEFSINASAYTAAADECGKSDGITASGRKVTEHRTLACPSLYSFGAKIEIDGMGTYICEDRGGAIKGNHFDIFMQTKKQAFAFGRRNLIAKVVR